MSAPPVDLGSEVVISLIVVLLVLRRSYALAKGARYSTSRLVGVAVVYLALWALTVGFDYYVLPIWSLPIDAALLVVGAVLATVHTRRVVEFYSPDGQYWLYRLGLLLPAIYLGLYLVRLAVELLIVPGALDVGTIPTLSGGQAIALLSVDALFSLSAGLLVGRSVGVYQAFAERQRNLPSPPPAAPPPPPPPLPF